MSVILNLPRPLRAQLSTDYIGRMGHGYAYSKYVHATNKLIDFRCLYGQSLVNAFVQLLVCVCSFRIY